MRPLFDRLQTGGVPGGWPADQVNFNPAKDFK
jgi:hypothetical protein